MGEKPTAALRAATRICLLVLVAVVAGLACSPSSKADPRCKIDAEGRHFDKLSQTINGSKLWSTYFDAIDPEATRTLVELRFLIGPTWRARGLCTTARKRSTWSRSWSASSTRT
jgi:hypothetical protein